MYNIYIESVKRNLKLPKESWDFKSDKQYTYMLEHVNQKQGGDYMREIIGRFGKIYVDNKDLLIDLCHRNDFYGKTHKVNFDNFTTCSPTNLRYILHSFLILTYMSDNLLNNLDIIEIGGGYGGLCFFINNLAHIFNIKISSYKIFDILEASELQKQYLDALDIKNTKCYQLDNFENLKTNSFLISNYAFSEISMDLQQKYTEQILNPYIDYGFIAWNHIPIYDFINNKKIMKETEFPLTADTNYYVKFQPIQ